MRSHLEAGAAGETKGWLLRTSALNLLARDGFGDRALAAHMWNLAPAQFRTEIIAAAAWRREDPAWADCLEGCRGDPVHEVVVAHVNRFRDG